MFCVKCGKKLADGAKFCTECGSSTGNIQPAAAVPMQTAAPTQTAPMQIAAPAQQMQTAAVKSARPNKSKARIIVPIVIGGVLVFLGLLVGGFFVFKDYIFQRQDGGPDPVRVGLDDRDDDDDDDDADDLSGDDEKDSDKSDDKSDEKSDAKPGDETGDDETDGETSGETDDSAVTLDGGDVYDEPDESLYAQIFAGDGALKHLIDFMCYMRIYDGYDYDPDTYKISCLGSDEVVARLSKPMSGSAVDFLEVFGYEVYYTPPVYSRVGDFMSEDWFYPIYMSQEDLEKAACSMFGLKLPFNMSEYERTNAYGYYAIGGYAGSIDWTEFRADHCKKLRDGRWEVVGDVIFVDDMGDEKALGQLTIVLVENPDSYYGGYSIFEFKQYISYLM